MIFGLFLIIILVFVSYLKFYFILFVLNYLELIGVKFFKERLINVCFLCWLRVYLKIKLKLLNKLDLKMLFLMYEYMLLIIIV